MIEHHRDKQSASPYLMFLVNMALSFVVMYLVMFSMIDGWKDFHNNLNMLYMALTMVAPMGLLMFVTMKDMYQDRRLNVACYVGLTLVFVAALAATRLQTFIDDRQFIASMVPHHSGAILMCREASLQDTELISLCQRIRESQRSEIEQMEAIRVRLAGAN